jgi:hypothetical protein
MNLLPKNTPLGKLHLLDTHIFYDGPKLFTAKNASGQKYLSFWLGQSDDRGDKWLYIPVSTPRHKSILTGDISLREACVNPEDGWVWIIESGHERAASSEMKLPGQIAESELPAEETFLNADIQLSKDIEDTNSYAKQSLKEVLDIEFSGQEIKNKEIPIDYLGSALTETQTLIQNIVYSQYGEGAKRGRIPKDIKEMSRMMAVDSYPSSFGIRLESRQSTGLFDTSTVGDAIRTLIHLIKQGNNTEKIIPLLNDLGSRVVSKYINFLSVYKKSDMDFNVHWGSPRHKETRVSSSMSSSKAKEIIDILSEKIEEFTEEIEIEGVLEGVDIQSKTFKILDLGSEQRITGKLKDSFVQKAKKAAAEVPKTYTATLIVTQEISPVTEESSDKYELKDLKE